MLVAVCGVGVWLLHQSSQRRFCDQYRVYPIDREMLQPITRLNLHDMQRIKVFSNYFYVPSPDVKFNPTSQSMAISAIGSSSSTLFPLYPVIWHFDDGCIQIPGDPTETKFFLEFSRDGEFYLLYDCLENDCYALYASTNGRLIDRFNEAAFVTFPEGEMLAYTTQDTNHRQFLDLNTMRAPQNDISGLYTNALLFSSDFRFMVTSSTENSFTLWDTAADEHASEVVESEEDDSGAIELLQFSPNNRWLVSKRRSGPVEVWNTETGERLLSLTKGNYQPGNLVFLRGGQQLAYGHYIWNLDTALPAAELGNSIFEESSIDGSFLVTKNGEAVVFEDGQNYEPLFSLDFAETIADVSISQDQKLLTITTMRETAYENIGSVELWGIPTVSEEKKRTTD